MDLNQLANLGEFVGGVAVLVTLVYLALQMRQANRQAAANIQFTMMAAFNSIHENLLASRDHAALLVKLESGAELDAIEQRQAVAFVDRILNVWFGVQQARDLNLVTVEFFEVLCADAKKMVDVVPEFRTYAKSTLARYPKMDQVRIFRPVFDQPSGRPL